MKQHNDVCQQPNPELVSPGKTSQQFQRLPALFVMVLLVVITLACGFTGRAPRPTAGRIVILTRLPTLTRTPLPTLIPASIAIAMAAEPVETAVVGQPPQPISVAAASDISSVSAAAPANVSETNTLAASGDASVVEPPQDAAVGPAANYTGTPTPAATATETPVPTSTPTPTATEIPPTETPTVMPTPTSLPDWLFVGVQLYPDPAGNGLLLYGNLVNNTGVAQELISITGVFYDEQGQVVANTGLSDAYWPGFVVSPSGSMPFELSVNGVENIGDYILSVEAEPSSEIPYENFEFSNLNQVNEGGDYCVNGKFQNPGAGLRNYLAITAIFYNDQDNVVNFGHYFVYYPAGVEADPDLEFGLCADSLNQEITHYEMQAWGL